MIEFIKPEERYIKSYWEAFDAICKEQIYLAVPEAFPLESTITFVKSAMEKGIPMLFAIDTKTDQCVGWCDVMPKTETVGYLGTGLLPAYREMGIGKRLIGELIVLSREYGYRQIELDVWRSNSRAIHVYAQFGFVVSGVVKEEHRLHGNAVMEDVVQMRLDLLV